MRIAYVYDAVYPWATGGVEKRVWEFARRLADDHDVHWYGLHYWEGPATRTEDGVTLHGVAQPPENLYVDGRRTISEALTFAARLVRPLLGESFDIIDCQGFPYFPVLSSKVEAVASDAALLLTWHEVWGDYWYDYLGHKGVFGKFIERLVSRLPEEHIAVSNRTSRDVIALGADMPHLVPNGIATDRVDGIPAPDEDITVIFAGRLIPEKNVPLLVDAIAQLADKEAVSRVVLVGDGPERSKVERKVRSANLESIVEVPGFLDSHDDVLALMKAAEVFVLPSEREGFGITALEALACGTPVVTIDHPRNAATELVNDGTTGRICRSTPEALANAILETRATIDSEACKAATREYDWDVLADDVEAVYRRTVIDR